MGYRNYNSEQRPRCRQKGRVGSVKVGTGSRQGATALGGMGETRGAGGGSGAGKERMIVGDCVGNRAGFRVWFAVGTEREPKTFLLEGKLDG